MIAKKFSVTNHIVGVSAIVFCTIVGCLNAGWWRTYGEGNCEGYCVQLVKEGGFIISGYNGTQHGIWLIRTDENGGVIWDSVYHRAFGGGDCVQQTDDGGYVITGSSASLFKTNGQGEILWEKTYDGWVTSGITFVQQTKDGGYITTGSASDHVESYTNLIVIKTDSDGSEEWRTTYGDEASFCIGLCIQETSDKGYIVTGGCDKEGLLLVKLDSLGNKLWVHNYYDSDDPQNYGWGTSVRQTPDGGYIVTGWADTRATLLLKTNSSGDSLWAKQYGNPTVASGGYCCQFTDEGYIVVGHIDYTLWILNTDSLGDTLWTKSYGGYGTDGKYINKTPQDEGYIVVGTTHCTGISQVFLLKTDSNGDTLIAEEEPPLLENSPFYIATTIGCTIILRAPQGSTPLALSVFDASGRRVDELILDGSSTITWGECYGPGVYFIRESSGKTPLTRKVILVK